MPRSYQFALGRTGWEKIFLNPRNTGESIYKTEVAQSDREISCHNYIVI